MPVKEQQGGTNRGKQTQHLALYQTKISPEDSHIDLQTNAGSRGSVRIRRALLFWADPDMISKFGNLAFSLATPSNQLTFCQNDCCQAPFSQRSAKLYQSVKPPLQAVLQLHTGNNMKLWSNTKKELEVYCVGVIPAVIRVDTIHDEEEDNGKG